MNGLGMIRRAWLLLLATLLLLPSASASAAVYWVGGPSLGLVNQDGSYPTYFWGQFSSSGVGNGCGVAVDASHIYWADSTQNVIGRSDLDGTDAELAFITGANEPCGVAVDGSHLYWANRADGTIGRARIDGFEVQEDFVTGLGRPCGVAVNESHIYWADPLNVDRVGRADLDGKDIVPNLIEEGGACGVAVDSQHIFWSTLDHSIGRANLDGSIPNFDFIGGLERPCGVATDGTHVFWAEQGEGAPGRIASANADGTDVNRNLFTIGPYLCGVAVNSLVYIPPPPRPETYFSFGKVVRNVVKGYAFIPVTFPAAGSAKIYGDGRGLNVRFLPERATSAVLSGPGVKWIKVSIDGKKKYGRHLLHRLMRLGKASVEFGLSYDEAGWHSAWHMKELTLAKHRGTHLEGRSPHANHS